MRLNKLKLFLGLSVLMVYPSIGFCESNEGHEKAPWMGPKADRNQDGIVDETEKQQAQEVWEKIHEKKAEIKAQADTNGDGIVDQTEMQQAMNGSNDVGAPKIDKDNNPPGPVGGPGTNWENPVGPVGGSGTSPNVINPPGPVGGPGAGPRFDKDNNPPGLAGGRGTNWENPAGPAGGPGASPNRGGKNPPGPKGGPGAGPRHKK